MTFTEVNQVSQGLAPVDINGGAVASDWFSMANYDHLTIFVYIGVHGGASTITVANASDNAGTGTADIAFNYRLTATTLVDDFGALTAAAAAGVATDGATTDIIYAVEIDSSELTDGMDFVQLKMSDPAAGTLVSIHAVGSRGKIKAATGQTLQS
jgi:hypothetical protein